MSNDKRKITSGVLVILSPGFAKDEADSTCLPAQQLFVRALNRQYPDLRIVILAFEYPYSRLPYLWYGNRVIPFDGRNRGKITKLRVWFSAWSLLNALRRENGILGLLSFWCSFPALTGSRYGKRHGIKHLIWILGQDARKGNRFIPLIRPQAGELVAMSEFLAEEFYRNYGIRPQHRIPNGIDETLYAHGEASYERGTGLYAPGADRRDIDVLGVGSLIPLKQYGLFLSVVRELSVKLPGIRVVICGKGPEEAYIRETIRKLELEDHVSLAGEQPHEKVLRLMQRSRVLLHPSSYEGFSTVCLEALYAGAHVVSLCRPMSSAPEHWHIAEAPGELPGLALGVLTDPLADHHPVLVYSMEESARKMMGLFGYSEAATS